MTEVDEATLVQRVGGCLAVIHLGRAGGLEYTGCVEGEGSLELAGFGSVTYSLLFTCGGIERASGIGVNGEAVQVAHLAGVAVDIELLAESLADKEQVIYMI